MHDPIAGMKPGSAPSPAPAESSRWGSFVRHNLREYGMLISLLAIMILFQWLTEGTLFQPLNLTNLLLQNSYIVIMALGMLLVIVAGHIDLSVGSVCGFIGALAAVLMVSYDWHWLPATLVCVAMGAAIGAAQGWLVAYPKIPSFIVTLGGMLVFRGLSLALLQGQSIGPFPDQFEHLSSGFVTELMPGGSLRITSLVIGLIAAVALGVASLRGRAGRLRHGMEVEPYAFFLGKTLIFVACIVLFSYLLSSYKGLPNVLIVMAVLIVIYDFVTRRTIVGRRIYALGGNKNAARLSGIKTERLTLLAFVNMGVLAALAGLVFAARLNTATPKAGLGFELDVIAACFIGGASATGGIGKVTGAVIGAFIMGVMNNGMSILGVGIDYQQVIKGLVLLAAVYVDVYNKNK
jgi:putative multiple sugar transport system permease protein